MPLDAEGCATRGHFGSIAQPVGRAVLALHATLDILALAALIAADSHAPAQKTTIVAPACQAGVVLETGGLEASRSTDFGTKREHRAVTTLPDGSLEVVAIPRPPFCAVAPAGKELGKLDE